MNFYRALEYNTSAETLRASCHVPSPASVGLSIITAQQTGHRLASHPLRPLHGSLYRRLGHAPSRQGHRPKIEFWRTVGS